MTANIELASLIRRTYDEVHAAANGEPISVADIRAAILPAVVVHLEGADRDFEQEATLLIDAHLRRERPKRANQLRRDLEFVVDYFENPAEAALGIEALLDRAYPLGTQAGEDMLLRYWSVRHLTELTMVRYREAADATEAAKALDVTAQRLIALMGDRGAATVGDAVAAFSVRAAS